MIYLFDIPVIKDDTCLPKLLKSDAATAKQYSFLSEADNLRRNFKKIVNPESIKPILMGESMLQYQEILEKYLKTNVDVMYILATTPSMPTQFKYSTFLSKKMEDYTTSIDSNEEACACEIVMVRFGFAFLMYADAVNNIKYVREKFTSSFLNDTVSKEPYIREINQALYKFKIGRDPLNRLYKVFPDVLKSLIKKKDHLINEFKGEIVFSVKAILEANANFLFIEQLRLLGEWEKISKVAKGTYNKLTIALKNFYAEASNINPLIIQYCDIALKYFYAIGIWAIYQSNKICMRNEDYKKKSFIVLAKESVNIAKELISIEEKLNKQKVQGDFYDFFLLYCKQWIPDCQHSLKVLTGVGNEEIEIAEPLKLFELITETLDYFDQL